MNYTESILVLSSLLFGTFLYILTLVNGPGITIFAGGSYIDMARLPSLIKFLLVVVLVSVALSYLITRGMLAALQYAGLNVLIGAIMGANLILVRKHPDHSDTEK